LLDDPADGFGRVGRGADLTPHVLARPELEPAKALLVFGERFESRVELADPRGKPDRALLDDAELEPREAVEHAVEDQRGERLHRWKRDRHEIDRAEVLGTAVEVGHGRKAVLEERSVNELAASAHVKDDRQSRFLRDLPDREEADVARRVCRRAGGGNEDRLAARGDRLSDHGARPSEVGERHEADRQEPPVARTEIDDRAVVGPRRRIGEVEVAAALVADEVVGEKRIEDELAREAEEIERARPVFLQKRAHRAPVLARQELLFGLLAVRGVAMAPAEVVDERFLAGLATAEAQRLEAVANLGIGVGDEPVGCLHDVGISVVHDAVFDVGHEQPPRDLGHSSTVENSGLVRDGATPMAAFGEADRSGRLAIRRG
jgi:hypothetical protein